MQLFLSILPRNRLFIISNVSNCEFGNNHWYRNLDMPLKTDKMLGNVGKAFPNLIIEDPRLEIAFRNKFI